MPRVPWSLSARDAEEADPRAERGADDMTPAEEALGRLGLWLGAGGAVLVVAASLLSATVGV